MSVEAVEEPVIAAVTDTEDAAEDEDQGAQPESSSESAPHSDAASDAGDEFHLASHKRTNDNAADIDAHPSLSPLRLSTPSKSPVAFSQKLKAAVAGAQTKPKSARALFGKETEVCQ